MSAAPVYLDHQATTPIDPAVFDAMLPYLKGRFGNPHSVGHSYGWEAAAVVRQARSQVAGLIGAWETDVIFTSGATESCNIAIRGAARAAPASRRRILTVATEHPAVLNTVVDLSREGFEPVIVPVDANGLVDLDRMADAVDDRTLLVSVMAANNEIGVVQPLVEIAGLCRRASALFHTDATQAAGRMSMSVEEWGVDLLSISAHKVYGPKGIGALYVRSGTPIHRVTTGGDQERGLRPGTVPAFLVAGIGRACELALHRTSDDANRMRTLAADLLHGLRQACPDVRLFGHAERRVAGSLCIGLPGLDAQSVVEGVADRIAVSTGSACSSASIEPSRVLLALGATPEVAATGVRISLGRSTSRADIETAADSLSSIATCHA